MDAARPRSSERGRTPWSAFFYRDQSDVTTYEAGTLVLDIVDTRTNDVIWRGWARDSVEGVLDNQDKMVRQISEAVERMLARLGPGQHGR